MLDKLLKVVPVLWPVVAGAAAWYFTWAQIESAREAARAQTRFDLIKYFFEKKGTVFDPCRDDFRANITTLVYAMPEIGDVVATQALYEQAAACAQPDNRKGGLETIAALQDVARQAPRDAVFAPAPTESPPARPPAGTRPLADYKVYIHYPAGQAEKREAAAAMRDRLQAAGYSVAGIEGVKVAPSRNEVRVYKSAQMDIGRDIANRAAPGDGFTAVDISPTFPKLPADYFEIWLAR